MRSTERYSAQSSSESEISILKESLLGGANLQKAIIFKTYLQQSVLIDANLQESIINYSILKEANLRNANLKGADLTSSDLSGAKYLTIDQLCEVKTLYNAKLDSELLEEVKKSCPQLLEEPIKTKLSHIQELEILKNSIKME